MKTIKMALLLQSLDKIIKQNRAPTQAKIYKKINHQTHGHAMKRLKIALNTLFFKTHIKNLICYERGAAFLMMSKYGIGIFKTLPNHHPSS
ncbi:hypothetical protein LU290_07580 [Moraxella nasibovis]|uniref:hypothetical protein n=1 Tax=Moraxella nasibovis TaxID=2904120 RepID=UPI00241096EC|nr:hypothetical protein [Moraxella nasibovis]WFF38115.1 hypothetical protein LU290_07580 [Moraxella nasibovis]